MIYFDNAATSYPKPPQVLTRTAQAMRMYSFNSGRGGYRQSLLAAERIYDVREKIGREFGFAAERVIFTKNCTEAINTAISGSVRTGDHIIISSLEHNSVARTVEHLRAKGIITYDIAAFSYDDDELLQNIADLLRPNTRAVVCTHSSNVFGVSMPVTKIGRYCRQNDLLFILDAAQGAGVADIDAGRDCIDILCAPGHKCLFGSMGTGFLAVGDNVSVQPLTVGGTGSSSFILRQPSAYPDRLESGTLNNSGIISIGEGLDFISTVGRDNILRHELELCGYLYDELSEMDGIILYTPHPSTISTMPILSFNVDGVNSERVAAALGDRDICVRAGYHCAPLAHIHFGTVEQGAVRLSPGYYTTLRECQKFVNVAKNLRF